VNAPTCTAGYCARPAAAAVHVLADSYIVIRTDHPQQGYGPETWRCLDCLHDDLDEALGLTAAVS
jgi:hypothetical protein